jgi:hypothetical protein
MDLNMKIFPYPICDKAYHCTGITGALTVFELLNGRIE